MLKKTALCLLLLVTGLVLSGNSCLAAPSDPPRDRLDHSPARQNLDSADPPGDRRDQVAPVGGERGLANKLTPGPLEKVVAPGPDSPRERRPVEAD